MSRLIETFIDEEREISYTCSATWGFLQLLSVRRKNLNDVFMSLANGELNPNLIMDVISCSLIKVNNDEINEAKRDKTALEIIERFGLQESSMIAREMISRAMVGDIKKKQLDQNLKVKALVDQIYQGSRLKTFYLLGSLWVTTLISSGLVAYLISK